MTTQLPLLALERARLPERTLAFASGCNEAREVRGFALAGQPVGFSAALCRREAEEELLASRLPVFADSGAFSEIAITAAGPVVANPISHESWLQRLAFYKRLSVRLGDRLYAVAPDRVADQHYTLALLARYSGHLQAIAQDGAQVLVPVQRGSLSAAEFYNQAQAAAALEMVPALPMKKAAMTPTDVLQFVREVRPRRLHLLGMGYFRTGAKRLVRALLSLDSQLEISLDSNRLRAITGRSRPLTIEERRLRETASDSHYGMVEHDALAVCGEQLDYTDSIAFPESWASPANLAALADEAAFSAAARAAFLYAPDFYLHTVVDGCRAIELPHVSLALDRAWLRFVDSRVQHQIRPAAIRNVLGAAF